MKKKPNLSKIFSFLLLFLTLGIVLYIGISGNDMSALADALAHFSPVYLGLCTLCWAAYVVFNALSMKHFLHMQGIRLSLWKCIHAAIVGIYYCDVTPGASGGQPMEMYQLSKYGVNIGVSGSALAIKFVAFQAVMVLASIVLWLIQPGFVRDSLDSSRWVLILGMVVNAFSITMILLISVNRNLVTWLIERVIRLAVKLHLCKNPEATRANWRNHCDSFLGSVQMIIRHPGDILIQLLIALAQLASQMVVIVFIYRALGMQGCSVLRLITLSTLLYLSASYVPLPGASGAQEGGFALFFGEVFPDPLLFVALLIWRFFTYYLSVLVGAVVTIADNLLSLRREKKEGAPVGK